MNIQLKKFEMSSIKDDSVVVFIGKRNTGKSYLVKDFLYHHQDMPLGTVISATESANPFYSSIVPSLFIHDKYAETTVENVLKRQKMVISKMRSEFDNYKSSKIDPRAFLILDDCLYDKSWTKSENIRCIFMNGRHYKLMFVLTMQYVMGIPPVLRGNIDYTFILRETNVQNRKRLYEQYAGMFPSFGVFCQVMDQCTNNYECLVVHNGARSNKLEDQVFWYKAEPRGDFKIGASQFWNHHSNNYNNKYNNGEEEIDIHQLHSGRSGPTINVRKV